MGDPCKQEAPIAEIKADNRRQDDILQTLVRTMEENTKLLRTLAEIGADVRHIREDLGRHDKSINSLYSRMRALELAPGQAMSKAAVVMLTTVCGSVGGVVTGLVMYLVVGAKP
jgi:chromosome segregation ATPase